MIQHNGKDLEQLSLEETIEFEKVMLKKVLSASKSQMSGPIIDQHGNAIGVAVAKLDHTAISNLFDAVPENVNFGIRSSVAANLLDLNNVASPDADITILSQQNLGQRISEGTLYLSCWMSPSQIDGVRFLRSLFEGL